MHGSASPQHQVTVVGLAAKVKPVIHIYFFQTDSFIFVAQCGWLNLYYKLKAGSANFLLGSLH